MGENNDFHIDKILERLIRKDSRQLQEGFGKGDITAEQLLPSWLIGVVGIIIILIIAFFVMVIATLIKNKRNIGGQRGLTRLTKHRRRNILSCIMSNSSSHVCDDQEQGKTNHTDLTPATGSSSLSSTSDEKEMWSQQNPSRYEYGAIQDSVNPYVKTDRSKPIFVCKAPVFVDQESGVEKDKRGHSVCHGNVYNPKRRKYCKSNEKFHCSRNQISNFEHKQHISWNTIIEEERKKSCYDVVRCNSYSCQPTIEQKDNSYSCQPTIEQKDNSYSCQPTIEQKDNSYSCQPNTEQKDNSYSCQPNIEQEDEQKIQQDTDVVLHCPSEMSKTLPQHEQDMAIKSLPGHHLGLCDRSSAWYNVVKENSQTFINGMTPGVVPSAKEKPNKTAAGIFGTNHISGFRELHEKDQSKTTSQPELSLGMTQHSFSSLRHSKCEAYNINKLNTCLEITPKEQKDSCGFSSNEIFRTDLVLENESNECAQTRL